jgi:hypothetical protein
LQTPNPVLATRTLLHAPPYYGYKAILPGIPLAEVGVVRSLAGKDHERVSYFGEFGNYVQLLTGVQSVSLFNDPDPDFFENSTTMSYGCSYLAVHGTDWLLVSPEIDAGFPTSICGLYKPVVVPGTARGSVYLRDGSVGT